MSLFRSLFIEHPASVGESYAEHGMHALSFGASMLRGALACFVHAVCPWLCTTLGSRTVLRLHDRMIVNRSACQVNQTAGSPAQEFLAEHI
jgi:hypothetical protein